MLFTCLGVIAACKKSTDVSGSPVTPTPGSDVLNLPATPFDYTTEVLPAYLVNIKALSPDFDNTPSTNPITNTGATLGRVLFYDKALSLNNTTACASCHLQAKAFSDGLSFSKGFDGQFTPRNSMSIINLRHYAQKKMFWDMRAADIETQVLLPIQNHIEMGITDLHSLETKLAQLSYYPSLFKDAFGTTDVTSDRISKALSQFVRSIASFNSRYDDGMGNNFANFTASENNGKTLFMSRCTECHGGLLSNTAAAFNAFINVSVPSQNITMGPGVANNGLEFPFVDKGIGAVTNNPALDGGFKIPMLRNIELTAPYMHDGRFATLEAVLDFYSDNVKTTPNLGVQIPVGGFKFTAQEKTDIVAFLKTLTDRSVTTDVKYSNPFK
ncbi:MAG: c-type cytochrome [Bacteroidetes bacterium]|nr:c-type cytochrome [Bacteroidota bacterium]